jgi:Tfp pilus assembly protein PilO
MKAGIYHHSKWVIVVPAVGLVAAYIFCAFLPGQRAIGKLQDELATTEQFIEQVDAMGPAVGVTQQEFDKTQTYVEAWETSAPTEEELSALFGRISLLAKQSGTTTTRFEPQTAVHYEKVSRIPVVLACTGSFAQICQFLHELEGLGQTVWVEALRMEGSGQNGEDIQCELTLGIFAVNPDDSDQVDQSG